MSANRSIIAVALMFSAFVPGLTGCSKSIPLPPELVGTYKSTDPKYENRFFTLTPSTIEIGLGNDVSQQHKIRSVIHSEENGRDLYTIEYLASYGRDRIAVFEKDGAIFLASQPNVRWISAELRR